MNRPIGLGDGVRLFGSAIMDTDDSRISRFDISPWYPHGLPLSWDMTQWARTVPMHVVVVPRFYEALEILRKNDALHLVETWGGCFNHRRKSGSSGDLSTHAWAAAIDVNPEGNERGRHGKQPWFLVWAFQKCGWVWGGEFTVPDPMHFQWWEGY